MIDKQQPDKSEQSEQRESLTGEAWQEVGKQFRVLGQSLATAFRTAWESEENRKHLEGMQANLEAMVNEVSQTMSDAVKSPEVQKMRDDFEKTAQSAREASEQSIEETRTHILSTLRQVKNEVEKMISHLEKDRD